MDTVESALAALRRGEPVIVLDHPERENEADLILAAEQATAERIRFMVRHTSGLICVALPGDRLDELDLPPVSRSAGQPVRVLAEACFHHCSALSRRRSSCSTVASLIRLRPIVRLSSPLTAAWVMPVARAIIRILLVLAS